MSTKATDLDSIAAAKAKLAEEMEKLERQEAELRQKQASKAFEQVLGLLNDFGNHFNGKQKADIVGFFGAEAAPKKRSRQQVEPKYWLPHSGETWTGRGRPPRAFTAWVGTVAHREWQATHPGEKFPKYPG